MSKVTLKGFILVPESQLELVKNELVNHKRLTLEETGCITFNVIQNSENAFRFDVYEEFTDKVAFEQHQKRVKASHWGKVTVNVERHYEVFE
ncbi:hypothetical protein MGA5115_03286 [Marinomonas gallaica]|uniref:ABM domain-containing protein n=1 Tax=Marinomonas gallaica TaxID=1806667 RepID=A0A1C3JVH5_9GAMM|nr:antibiotic biosynthesis monooxygenase [Marinomonas gallaica]SBT19125.1 hypothetical protein MGA5115_03286 [Marinomonas gallaica]SBT22717.1 hypothetical protein MGA5116_03342 [Marinomonas gallaica]